MRCRKIWVEMESFQYWSYHTNENIREYAPCWFVERVESGVITFLNEELKVRTFAGVGTVRDQDYIMLGVNDELSICKRDIYEMTYEEFRVGDRTDDIWKTPKEIRYDDYRCY